MCARNNRSTQLWMFFGIVTVYSVIILCFNLKFINSVYWWSLVCDKSLVRGGQYWRCMTYVIPHCGVEHLGMDIAYLYVVACIAIRYVEVKIIYISWSLCGLFGGAIFSVFDTNTTSIAGSSAATHGLLALVSVFLLFATRNLFIQTVYLFTLVYLFCISVYAIQYGVVPTTHFQNPGWDHLGGTSAGMIIGLFYSKFAKGNRGKSLLNKNGLTKY